MWFVGSRPRRARALIILVPLIGTVGGCSEETHVGLQALPEPGADRSIAFTDEELAATPEMRLLREVLDEAAREGQASRRADDVDTLQIQLAIDEKWADKYGSPPAETGHPLPSPRIVAYAGETFRVLVVTN